MKNTLLWDERYSIDEKQIDSQHRKLFELLNEVCHLAQEDQATPLFSTIKMISELSIYAIFHFREEENLMKEIQYPDLEAHQAQHNEYIQKINQLKENYQKQDPLINYEILDFLNSWLTKHILIEDMKYKNFL
ncbi:MAG: hemerythrin family protein [Vallitaleaceae bacterium]|nr:hemerythrin family protein [Vallitaleaceae bacterium]